MPQVATELHSRPPFERMMRIHESLKAGHYPNCSKLARAIEVSTRTIKRDVDFMKYCSSACGWWMATFRR